MKREKDIGGMDFYKNIFDNLPFVAFTLDRKGILIEANKHAEKLFGMFMKDAKNAHFSKICKIGKRDLLKAYMEFRKNLSGKVTGKSIYRVTLKDKREIFLELIGIPLKENGKVTKVLDVGSDVTERIMREREMKMRNNELEKFNKIAVGRELEMIKLKNRIKELEEKTPKK